ncbi:TonB-dependent receptor plug domain-containing protein [Helicobacter saguini]|uniref:TonB-dependent receptor plug domain-containing protein n=1 Tax=Helicobacter saguini TaxID=1548018 RepID=A0A4U8T6Y7_9HELI|nr:TonB-dependent receptor plug domain-containing protein [Helicobacter saguini]MWV61130.1 TonB-dependent receptor plug domain-containing protein [Helicobacter saguini]MWV68201.1 TonB-dependent receptor plug domain-containing protein [Helicobacter saguini]TLD95284.1 hypothetical protein LS64_002730 [Helicobacter saguini]
MAFGADSKKIESSLKDSIESREVMKKDSKNIESKKCDGVDCHDFYSLRSQKSRNDENIESKMKDSKQNSVDVSLSLNMTENIESKVLTLADIAESSTLQDSNKDIESYKLNKVTTTANTINSDIDKDVSKNIITITKEEISNKGYQNLEQALEHQPFVNFVDSGFGRNIDLRGQGKDSNRAVKILVNGVPINSLDTISGVASFNNLNLEDVEGIEILPGGSSVVYGSGSRGGVVNIITKKIDKDYLKVSLKGSSAEALGLQGGSLSINGGKKLNDSIFLYGSVGVGYIPGPRNTNIKPPAIISSYSISAPTQDQQCPDYVPGANGELPSATQGQAWYPSCDTSPLGETKNATFLNYHDNNLQFNANFGLNYNITESQRLEFNTTYAYNRLKRIPTYLDSRNRRIMANPAYESDKSQPPFLLQSCNPTTGVCRWTADTGSLFPMDYVDLKERRYTIDMDFVGMDVHSMNNSLKYNLAINDSSTFDIILYHNMNLINYTNYYKDGMLPTMYSDLAGSYFHNHNSGLNMKYKLESDKNMLLAGLDNTLGYAIRKLQMDAVIADWGSILPGLGKAYLTTNADNSAFKYAFSPYVYDKYDVLENLNVSGGARIEYSFYRVTNNQRADFTKDESLNGVMPDMDTGNLDSANFDIKTHRFAYALEISPEYNYYKNGYVFSRLEYGFISPSPFQMIDADPENEINQGGSEGPPTGTGTKNLIRNTYNNLQPEKYLTFEIGVKDTYKFDNFWVNGIYLSATTYYTHTFDEIFLNQTSGTNSFLYRNIGQTQRAGFEILSNQSFIDNRVRLAESIGYVWTNIYKADRALMESYAANTNVANFALEGSRVPYVPEWKITLKIEGDIIRSSKHILSGLVQMSYTGESYSLFISSGRNPTNSTAARPQTSDEIYSVMNKGGYFLMDLGLTYGFNGGKWNKWKVSLGARNILDTFYKTYQSRYYYYPAMGRSYYLEAKWEF